jgi:hypothetical protein
VVRTHHITQHDSGDDSRPTTKAGAQVSLYDSCGLVVWTCGLDLPRQLLYVVAPSASSALGAGTSLLQGPALEG